MAEIDPRTIPASIIQASLRDPARGTGAPPNFGMDVVPHIHTASGRFGVSSKSYLNMDEALQDSRANAQRMRADCGIMECVEGRQRTVALCPWHLAVDDEKSQEQKDLAAALTTILENTPYFTEYRRVMQEAIWYGRYAVANQYGSKNIGGKWRTVIRRWEPRHGDKLVFRYDDGSHDIDPDQIGIRVSSAFRPELPSNRDEKGRARIQATESGLVYWLNRWERATVAVHKHLIEDGPWDQPRMAGRIHGVGIRDRIYWTWYAQIECLQRVIEYLDRAAFGIEIWPYQSGNQQAKTETEKAAYAAMGGGRTVILAPIPAGEDSDRYMPQLVEPGLGGVNTTIEIIRTYFGHKIKRYILGQTLSSEADSTGMGSGVADAHLATLGDILSYDAVKLQEAITTDILRPMQLWNFPKSAHIGVEFVIDTESDNVRERLEAIGKAYEMGLKIKSDELYQIIGSARPDADDEILANPKIYPPQQPGMPPGMVPGSAAGGEPAPPGSPKAAFAAMRGAGAVFPSPEAFAQSLGRELQNRGLAK